jgi:hypothetical protein
MLSDRIRYKFKSPKRKAVEKTIVYRIIAQVEEGLVVIAAGLIFKAGLPAITGITVIDQLNCILGHSALYYLLERVM